MRLDPEALDLAWKEYKANDDLESRNALMIHYLPTVRYAAGKIGDTLPPTVELEDLVSYGLIGLLDALEKFDPDKGVQFQTYGVARIRGEIYDQIRALDWVPRSVRSQGRLLKKARSELEDKIGRPAEVAEVAEYMGISLPAYHLMASQSFVPQVGAFAIEHTSLESEPLIQDSVFDPMMNPESLVVIAEVVSLMSEVVNTMDEKSKTILVLYYLQDMTLAEIGQVLGVTESRVCQLQSKMLSSLRDSLGAGSPVGALS